MPRSLIFWAIFFIVLFFYVWAIWPISGITPGSGGLLVFVLVGLLGWKVYGPAIKQD